MARRTPNTVIDGLKADYLAGQSLTQLQAKYGFERHALSRCLRKHGVDVVLNNQQHKVNSSYFDTVDTEEKAYWLGFWYADGYLRKDEGKLELTLAEKDLSHLVRFRDALGATYPLVRKAVILGDKVHIAYRLTFSCKPLHTALIALGCPPQKTHTLKFPTNSQVPEHLLSHFIRGFFDGDGTVGSYTAGPQRRPAIQLGFEGTASMLASIQDVFVAHIPGYTRCVVKQHTDQHSCTLQKGGNLCVKPVYDYLYADATIWLPRKRDVFIEHYKLLDCRSSE